MLNDVRGVAVTSSNADAVSAYDDAVNESVLYIGDPVARCAGALELDPNLILGHTLNAMYNLLGNTRQGLPDALNALEKAENLTDIANPRELGHIAAVRAWYDGDFVGSSAHWDGVLVDNPRDLFALQMGHLLDFYTGSAANMRDRVARVLPAWDDSAAGRDAKLRGQSRPARRHRTNVNSGSDSFRSQESSACAAGRARGSQKADRSKLHRTGICFGLSKAPCA